MKKQYIINSNWHYSFSAWFVIALGYHSQYFQYDKYNVQQFRSWYFLCFKLSATRYLQEVKGETK